MMKTLKIKIISLLLFLSVFGFSVPMHAQTLSDQITGQYQKSAQAAEVGAVDPRVAIAELIKLILTLFGTIFLVLVVLAGYWLLTARGDEAKVEKANKTIRAAVIGLTITLAAYSVTYFVGNGIKKAVSGDMTPKNDQLKWSDLNND